MKRIRGLSLRTKVPLYIAVGLTVLLASWTWLSYGNVRDVALAAGTQRLNAVTTQFRTSYDSAARAYLRGIRPAANNPAIVEFMATGGSRMGDSVQRLLARSVTGPNHRLTLFSLDGTPLLTLPAQADPPRERHAELDEIFARVAQGPEFASIAPLRIMDDSVVAPVVSAVLRDSQPIGYMVLWRRVTSNNTQIREQASNLIGGAARIYIGNQRGDLWRELSGQPAQFPPALALDGKPAHFTGADDRAVMASALPIRGTPWAVAVEFDENEILAPATQIRNRSIMLGITVLILATMLGGLLSRRVTVPLHDLTEAATAVAGGNYKRAVSIGRNDELGKLASAFNTMAARVGESQQALEVKVSDRTEQLRERNEELEAFAHSISHDLRAPLRAMHGFSQALLEDHADQLDENGKDYARRIAVAAQRMDALTRDLLEYSRVSRGELTISPIELGAVAQGAISQLEADIGARGALVTIQEPMLRVLAHRPLLEQVVTNLVSNALKFVPAGTTPTVNIRSESRGSSVRLWVEDNGIGIDPSYHQRIFSVFERLHGNDQFEGTGIGLAIVRRAVERMGGTSGVESAPGAGSRFWVELRATEA